MGGESTVFEFQGNKLLEGATNLDARFSNYNRASGGQSIVDRRVDASTVIMIENLAIGIGNVEGTLSRVCRREPVKRTSSREPVERTPLRERRRERRRENLAGNVSVYKMIVRGVVVICCMVVLHALRVVLR